MVHLCAKFEVSRYTHYKAANGGAKCKNGVVRGHSRSWAVSPFNRARTTSYSVLIETVRLSLVCDQKVWSETQLLCKAGSYLTTFLTDRPISLANAEKKFIVWSVVVIIPP